MNSNLPIFRIAILGSGTTSYGALLGIHQYLSEISTINNIQFLIDIYIDDRNIVKNYNNSNQINRRLGVGGTSKFWHSVSPLTSLCSEQYKNLFSNIYQFNNKKSFKSYSDQIFIPFFKPNLKKLYKKIIFKISRLRNVICFREINSHVISVVKMDDSSIKLIDNKGVNRFYDIIFFGISILDIDSIKFINCDFPKFKLVDHNQVHVGLYKPNLFSNNLLPIYTLHGFFLRIKLFKNHCVMIRPWHSDIKNISLNSFQNFGKSYFTIFIEMFLTFSFGKIKEAFATKFGFFYKAKYYSIWVQSRYEYHSFNNILDFNQDNCNKIYEDAELNNFLNSLPGFIQTGFSIPGNHIIGESLSLNNNESSLHFLTIFESGWMDGRHHTLRMSSESLSRAYLALKSCIVEKTYF